MYRLWRDEEIKWLLNNYETLGLSKCSEFLNRSKAPILHKASRLGIANRRGGDRKPRFYYYGGYETVSEVGNRYQTHRKVVEDYLGITLTEYDVVHHKNNNKLDNRIENLELTTKSEHQKIYHRKDLENRRDTTTGKFTSGLRYSLNNQENELIELSDKEQIS